MASSAFIFLLLVSFLVVANAQGGSQAFSLPGGILSLTSPDGTLPGSVFHTPTDSNSQSSTGTPTDTSSQSGPTPQLSFLVSSNSLMTTCTSASISWLYIGPQGIPMNLGVTNYGVSQSSPAPTSHTNTFTNGDDDLVRKGIPGHLTTSGGSGSDDSEGNVNEMLTTIDPDERVFQWASVNIPQGWYIAQATINGIVTPSQPFFVQNGTDVSCLPPPTGTTTTSSTTSSMPTNSPTSSGPPQTTPGSELPVGGSSGSNLNKGAIAGGVIGGLAVLAAIIAAIFFYRYSSSSSSPRRPNGGFMGKWGNLGSFDSTSPAKVKQAKARMYNNTGVGLAGLGVGTADPQRNLQPSSRHNSQTESIGPIIYHDARRTPGGSSEEVFSPYDEKYMRSPFSDPGHGDGSEELGMIPIGYDSTSSPSIGLATAGHATRHSSMNSTYSYAQNNNFSRPRSQSTQYKASSSPQTFPESPSLPNTSNATIDTVSRRASSPIIPVQMSTSSLDHAPPSPAYPSGASAAMSAPQSGRPTPSPIPMAGMAGVGAGGSSPMTPTSRKTPRKPVPTYNPQDPSLLEPPTRIADVPTDVRNSDLQDLNHKGSFGSFKQVHILMPDMPPPQKD